MDFESENNPAVNAHHSSLTKGSDYTAWLKSLKAKIRSAQVRAALAASRELILFYWELGESISRKLVENDWGAKVIDRLSKDLRSEFPDMQGFSRRNLYYVKKFYEFFSLFSAQVQFVPPPGAQLENRPQAGDEKPQSRAQTIPGIVQQL